MAERRKTPLDLHPVEPELCSIDLRLQILGRLPFFAGLKSEDITAINRLFHDQGYSTGQTIYYSGDPASHLYVVADGRVRLLRHTTAGKDVLLDLLTPGEFFGSLTVQEGEQYAETAQAQSAACVLRIARKEFRQILNKFPQVAVSVLTITALRLQEAQEWVRRLSVSPVERRIAYALLKLGNKFGQEGELGLLIQVPLSREDLAHMAGTTTETASRVVSQFQKDGLIQTGRQWAAITDLRRLKALGGEET
jgi:CRP/FNR family transcriptional regulator, nitrogen oxide reductase regulator